MKLMWGLLRPYWLWLALGGLLYAVASLANFGLMFLSGWLLAAAAAAGLGGMVARHMFNMALFATGVRFFAIVRIVARYGERLFNHDVALRLTGQLRAWSFEKLIPHSLKLSRMARSGDILACFVSDTEKMGQVYLDVLLPGIGALVCGLVTSAVTGWFCPQAGLILAAFLLAAGIFFPLLAGILISRPAMGAVKNTELLQAEIVESLHGMADLSFCGRAADKIALIGKIQKDLSGNLFQENLRANLLRQIIPFLCILCVVFALLVSDRSFLSGTLTGPEIPMLVLGILASFELILPLVDSRLAWEKFKRAHQRLVALCVSGDEKMSQNGRNREKRKKEKSGVAVPSAKGAPILEIQNVALSYPGQPQPILKGLDLAVKPGERVAIVGPSGAGKSSLIRLAVKLLHPNGGEIFYKGGPLSGLDTASLSRSIGVLAQDYHLFGGTLRDNLLLACPDASEADMWEALQKVNLREEVAGMKEGLDTQVGEHGVRLSGGQGRRLACAQILLRRPDLLLLDEPTEGLPPQDGEKLVSALLEALPHASVVCITHRREPLPFMDRVLRLENGYLSPEEGAA